MRSSPLNTNDGPTQNSDLPADAKAVNGLEERARAAFEFRLGHGLTEDDWSRFRNRLVEFAIILRTWQKAARTKDAETGKVVVTRSRRGRRLGRKAA